MKIRTYQYESDGLNELANQIRYSIITNLKTEGLLTKEQADLYNHTHFVTITEKFILFPWFSKAKNSVNIYVSKIPYQIKDIEEDDKSDEDK